MSLTQHLPTLPRLGVGISCEFDGSMRGPGIDALSFRAAYPELVHFLEFGADTQRGLDAHMLRWADAGLPATYHFLDLNLAEAQDLDAVWLQQTLAQVKRAGAVWLCGDAGYWHLGRRERGHELLLPPILCAPAAQEMGRAVAALQRRSGMLVLPENPPATAFVGPMHLLEFYAQVTDQADCGFLLDCSHLAIFQRLRGHDPLDGLADFPLERVLELHLAGGRERETEGFTWVEDSHSPTPLPDALLIFEHLLQHAPNLRAVVYECEHNRPEEVAPTFEALNQMFPKVAP